MADDKSLVKFEESTVLDLFTKKGEIDTIISHIDNEMTDMLKDVDPDSKKGRELIRSVVAKGVSSRTYTVAKANNLTSDWKAKTKTVNSTRDKFIEEAKQNEAKHRKPLTDFEEIEKKRKIYIKNTIEQLKERCQEYDMGLLDDSELKKSIDWVNSVVINDDLGEMKDSVELSKIKAISSMGAEVERREIAKKQAAELKEKEALEAAEKEKLEAESLRKEGEERARIVAEEEAEKQAAKVELEKKQAKEREDRAVQAAKDAEKRAKEAEIRAKVEAEQAEKKRIKDIEDAKKAEIERQRIESEKLEADRLAREADTAHRKKVNNKIVKDLVKIEGVTNELAKSIVIAIAKKQVFETVIKY